MKKIVSILSIITCMIAISVNVMIQTKNEYIGSNLKLLSFQAKAQEELQPMNEWTVREFECPPGGNRTWGRSCLRVTVGSPDCNCILCD